MSASAMVEHDSAPAGSVDVAFELAGRHLQRDYAHCLLEAVAQQLPWFKQEPLAGIHPLKLVSGTDGAAPALLSRRTRLLLRVARASLSQTLALTGRELAIGQSRLQVGQGQARELLPHATLYAHQVCAADDDELQFINRAQAELDAMGVRYLLVCGKNQRRELNGQTLSAYSLMLHGLSPADSLRIQERGIGPHRQWGYGLFVPHKSAAAVGF